ncbi:hypothetical protein COBT_000229 [Conglomerata obtusa]
MIFYLSYILSKELIHSKPGLATLSFDEGPSKNIPKILEILQDLEIHATFHLDPIKIKDDIASSILSQGHTVGLAITDDILTLSYDEFEKMLLQAIDLFKDRTKTVPKLIRLPRIGYDARHVEIAEKAGLIVTAPICDSEDCDLSSFIEPCRRFVGGLDPDVQSLSVVFRDRMSLTVRCLTQVVEVIENCGFEIVSAGIYYDIYDRIKMVRTGCKNSEGIKNGCNQNLEKSNCDIVFLRNKDSKNKECSKSCNQTKFEVLNNKCNTSNSKSRVLFNDKGSQNCKSKLISNNCNLNKTLPVDKLAQNLNDKINAFDSAYNSDDDDKDSSGNKKSTGNKKSSSDKNLTDDTKSINDKNLTDKINKFDSLKNIEYITNSVTNTLQENEALNQETNPNDSTNSNNDTNESIDEIIRILQESITNYDKFKNDNTKKVEINLESNNNNKNNYLESIENSLKDDKEVFAVNKTSESKKKEIKENKNDSKENKNDEDDKDDENSENDEKELPKNNKLKKQKSSANSFGLYFLTPLLMICII